MTQGTGRGQVYEGPASEMKDSDWLSVEDMQASGREHIDMTIERVLEHQNVEFEMGRKKARCFSIAFKGAGKQLLINATNRKRLVRMFGGNTKDWLGKRVRLHLEEDKLPKGGRGPCTRIIEAPQQNQAPSPEEHPQQEEQARLDGMPSEDNWQEGLT